MKNNIIENYAKSLLKHGLYPTIAKARKEATRWYKKHERGLEEPLQCPHHPDIKTTITENGVEYKLPEK
jgi:hypothetical protein